MKRLSAVSLRVSRHPRGRVRPALALERKARAAAGQSFAFAREALQRSYARRPSLARAWAPCVLCWASFCFCSRRVATQLRLQAIACRSLGAVCARVLLWNCVSFVCVLPFSLLCGCLVGAWRAVERRETEKQTCRKDVTADVPK